VAGRAPAVTEVTWTSSGFACVVGGADTEGDNPQPETAAPPTITPASIPRTAILFVMSTS
jgi:hypothetical protein